jgi:hypothetical protein
MLMNSYETAAFTLFGSHPTYFGCWLLMFKDSLLAPFQGSGCTVLEGRSLNSHSYETSWCYNQTDHDANLFDYLIT